jgi:hypothetical protein
MKEKWQQRLECAIACSRCDARLDAATRRILSVYDHRPICLACKQKEESKPDYEQVSRDMIGQCMHETEMFYSDPGGYCYYHFYPFTCG